MGKSLIIKGADFSVNAITSTIAWYNEYTNLVGENTGPAATKFNIYLPYAELEGFGMKDHPVEYIKLHVDVDGLIKVGKVQVNVDLTDITATDVSITDTLIENVFSDVSAGENTLYLPTPITITSADVAAKNIALNIYVEPRNILRFNDSTGDGWSYWGNSGYTSKYRFPIQFGYKQMG
jgi:hypothetical protein